MSTYLSIQCRNCGIYSSYFTKKRIGELTVSCRSCGKRLKATDCNFQTAKEVREISLLTAELNKRARGR